MTTEDTSPTGSEEVRCELPRHAIAKNVSNGSLEAAERGSAFVALCRRSERWSMEIDVPREQYP